MKVCRLAICDLAVDLFVCVSSGSCLISVESEACIFAAVIVIDDIAVYVNLLDLKLKGDDLSCLLDRFAFNTCVVLI